MRMQFKNVRDTASAAMRGSTTPTLRFAILSDSNIGECADGMSYIAEIA